MNPLLTDEEFNRRLRKARASDSTTAVDNIDTHSLLWRPTIPVQPLALYASRLEPMLDGIKVTPPAREKHAKLSSIRVPFLWMGLTPELSRAAKRRLE